MRPSITRRGALRWLAALVAAVATIGSVSAVVADDWPQYGHDANHTGNNLETILSPSNASSLAVQWSFATGDVIADAPAVVGGTVYVGSWDGYLYALDAQTGRLKWRTYLGVTVGGPGCEPPKAGVSSSPAVANGVVYVGGGDSYFYALDATTGAILWRVFTGDNSATSGHYNWSSPSVLGDGRIFLGVASFGDCPKVRGQVLEIDAKQQKTIATADLIDPSQLGGGVWMSAASLPTGGTTFIDTGSQYVNAGSQALSYAMIALSWNGLKVRDAWQLPLADRGGNPDSDWSSSPVTFQTSTGAWRVGAGQKNGNFYAFDATNLGQGPLWWMNLAQSGPDPLAGTGTLATAFYDGDHLFVGGGHTNIYGTDYPGAIRELDPDIGAIQWEQGTPSGIVLGALAGTNGLLVDGAGPTLEVRNTANGQVLYQYKTGGPIYGGAAIANGMIYVGSTDHRVYAFGVPGVSGVASVPSATATPMPTVPPHTPTLGANVVGQTFDIDSDQNTIVGSPIVVTTANTVTGLRVFLQTLDSTSPTLQAAIYADNGGAPGSLVWGSPTATLTKTGWETVPVPNVPLQAGQTYWLVYNVGGATTGGVWTNGAGSGWTASEPFGTWPDPAPSGTANSHLESIAAVLGSAPAPAPTPRVVVFAAPCQFALGFKTLHDLIPNVVGNCLASEHFNSADGDALQETAGPTGAGGLLVWRKSDNWTAFTDGYHTWVNGPNGVQERLNTQRFAWEANPDGLPLAQ